jgi:hypothetical protein
LRQYRAFPIEQDCVVGASKIIRARDDEDAINQAAALFASGDVELWEGPRRVNSPSSFVRE